MNSLIFMILLFSLVGGVQFTTIDVQDTEFSRDQYNLMKSNNPNRYKKWFIVPKRGVQITRFCDGDMIIWEGTPDQVIEQLGFYKRKFSTVVITSILNGQALYFYKRRGKWEEVNDEEFHKLMDDLDSVHEFDTIYLGTTESNQSVDVVRGEENGHPKIEYYSTLRNYIDKIVDVEAGDVSTYNFNFAFNPEPQKYPDIGDSAKLRASSENGPYVVTFVRFTDWEIYKLVMVTMESDKTKLTYYLQAGGLGWFMKTRAEYDRLNTDNVMDYDEYYKLKEEEWRKEEEAKKSVAEEALKQEEKPQDEDDEEEDDDEMREGAAEVDEEELKAAEKDRRQAEKEEEEAKKAEEGQKKTKQKEEEDDDDGPVFVLHKFCKGKGTKDKVKDSAAKTPKPEGTPAPDPNPEEQRKPEPAPTPVPEPRPEPNPNTERPREPEPVQVPTPNPKPAEIPQPAPTPVREPVPVREPTPGPEPKPILKPKPAAIPEPAPTPVPQPQPLPAPRQNLNPEERSRPEAHPVPVDKQLNVSDRTPVRPETKKPEVKPRRFLPPGPFVHKGMEPEDEDAVGQAEPVPRFESEPEPDEVVDQPQPAPEQEPEPDEEPDQSRPWERRGRETIPHRILRHDFRSPDYYYELINDLLGSEDERDAEQPTETVRAYPEHVIREEYHVRREGEKKIRPRRRRKEHARRRGKGYVPRHLYDEEDDDYDETSGFGSGGIAFAMLAILAVVAV